MFELVQSSQKRGQFDCCVAERGDDTQRLRFIDVQRSGGAKRALGLAKSLVLYQGLPLGTIYLDSARGKTQKEYDKR